MKKDVLKQLQIASIEEGLASEDLLQKGRGGRKNQRADGQAHYFAYHRLRNTGWLVEELISAGGSAST